MRRLSSQESSRESERLCELGWGQFCRPDTPYLTSISLCPISAFHGTEEEQQSRRQYGSLGMFKLVL